VSRPARPRIRSVKPEQWQDERFAGVSRDALLLYIGLVTQADDEGRQSGHLALLKARIFPFHRDAETLLQDWLTELAEAALVELYQVDDRRYISLPSWGDDQRVDKPVESAIPAPEDVPRDPFSIPREASRGKDDASRTFLPSRAPADRTGPGPGTGPERNGGDHAPEGAPPTIDEVQVVYDTWLTATKRDATRTKFTPERRRHIKTALKTHGLTDCLTAITNIGKSDDARNGYGNGQRYDDIKHVLKTAEQIERWRDSRVAPEPRGDGFGARLNAHHQPTTLADIHAAQQAHEQRQAQRRAEQEAAPDTDTNKADQTDVPW
jgi:hypothetical protein